jgi:hypothetical protein
VKGKKLGTISEIKCCSQERLIAEMEKCEVRCANCHAIVTEERRNGPQKERHVRKKS